MDNTMNKNEALIAAIGGGKKIQCTRWDFPDKGFIKWNGVMFTYTNEKNETTEASTHCFTYQGHWRIVPETVDFWTAWKAYEQGKIIKSNTDRICKKSEEFSDAGWASRNEIRGQWQILD